MGYRPAIKMKKTFTLFLLFIAVFAVAQQQLTLNECYTLVKNNYPLNHQTELLSRQTELDLAIINTKKLPQLNFAAQATYQSDVIGLPLPNATPLNKDQYKATLTANQLIYGGNQIAHLLNVKDVQLKTAQKEIEVSLYQLKKQVNQIYFSVLLIQQKKALLTNKQALLQTKLKEVQSGIKYGVLLPASDTVLETELAKIKQQFVALISSKEVLINTLSTLTKTAIPVATQFKNPMLKETVTTTISRPEHELFQLKKETVVAQEQLLSKENYPKLIGFVTGGYGNPGLNMLDNSFQEFYVVGLKLNWKVFDWNANKKKRQAALINKEIIDNQTELFDLNTNIKLQQEQVEIAKLEQFIITDLKIIELRKKVLKTTASQLKNGVVTSSIYVTELSNLFEDENALKTHEIQLLLAQANYNVTIGN